MRLRLTTMFLLCLATTLAASVSASSAVSPKAQALELKAAIHQVKLQGAAANKREAASQKELNDPNACQGALKRVPKAKQPGILGLELGYSILAATEEVAPLLIEHDAVVQRLHLSDPVFKQYASALHALALGLKPLASAKLPGFCVVVARWQKSGYAATGSNAQGYALFGVTKAQASGLAVLNNKSPVAKAFTKAKDAAGKHALALGVTFDK